ncbi:MAG: zinc ribbon domain-containing protein [Acidimicrobiales bacterium]
MAERFFPSSKLCSSCGETKAELSLAESTYRCEHCGLVIDRDLNAALNLAAMGGGRSRRVAPRPKTRVEDGTAGTRRSLR